jgi:hypothetical protein
MALCSYLGRSQHDRFASNTSDIYMRACGGIQIRSDYVRVSGAEIDTKTLKDVCGERTGHCIFDLFLAHLLESALVKDVK